MRERTQFHIFGTMLILFLYALTDPDTGLIKQLPFGASSLATLVLLLKGFLGVTMLHVARKIMHDYEVADFESLGEIAKRTPEGAGRYAQALATNNIGYAIVIGLIYLK